MRITWMTDVDVEEWDRTAADLGGGYFHAHAEAAYCAAIEDSEPMFLRAENNDGQCIGVATGAFTASRVWPFSRCCNWANLLSLPAVRDGSAETQLAVMGCIEDHLRRRGAFSCRVCSYDAPGSAEVLSLLGYSLSERTEFCLDLTPSLDDIWSSLRGARRTDVRKAEKLGVETRLENTQEGIEKVFSFQTESMARRGMSLAGANSRLEKARQDRLESGLLDVFVTYLQGSPVNASLFGAFNGRAYYHVSGSSDDGYKCCGPVQLLWTAIKTYKERGATMLNLGAALADQKGLYRFKRDFGTTPAEAPVGTKVISMVGAGLDRLRSLMRGGRS